MLSLLTALGSTEAVILRTAAASRVRAANSEAFSRTRTKLEEERKVLRLLPAALRAKILPPRLKKTMSPILPRRSTMLEVLAIIKKRFWLMKKCS